MPPTSESFDTEDASENKFCILVSSSPEAGHDFGTLCLGEKVVYRQIVRTRLKARAAR